MTYIFIVHIRFYICKNKSIFYPFIRKMCGNFIFSFGCIILLPLLVFIFPNICPYFV